MPIKSSKMILNHLSSMDIGHLLEDIFDNDYLSVWYTVSTSKMRHNYGDEHYAGFLNCFEHVLVTWLKETKPNFCNKENIAQLQELLCCMMFMFSQEQPDSTVHSLKDTLSISEAILFFETNIPCIASIKQFQRLKFVNGWSAAIERSKYIHNFLKNVYYQLTWCFPILEEYDLLLRGSCAQGIMTTKSDVDFEVSSENKPHGFNAVESIISSLLSIFDIDCEGSSERPTEVDMESIRGFTRDFHEWCELVIPESYCRDKGWNDSLYNEKDTWQYYSEYESQKHNISTKYLFFQIRAIIERYALKYEINRSFISDILEELHSYLPNKEITLLSMTLQDCMECYEKTSIDIDKCMYLKRTIDYLYVLLNIQYNDRFIKLSESED